MCFSYIQASCFLSAEYLYQSSLEKHKSVLILIILFIYVLFKRRRHLFRFHKMYSSPSIIKTVKSWMGRECSTHGGEEESDH
jgi:amino acid permease